MKKFLPLLAAFIFCANIAIAQQVSVKGDIIMKDDEPYAKLVKTGGLRPQYSLQTLDGKEIFVAKAMDVNSPMYTIIFMDDGAQAYMSFTLNMKIRLAKEVVDNNLILNDALNPSGKTRFIALNPTSSAQSTVAPPPVYSPAPPVNTAPANGPYYTTSTVDRLPMFPGGDQGLSMYFKSTLVYPVNDRSRGIEGTVKVKFVVATNGQVTNVEVLEMPTAEMGNEALRVMRTMPNWTPGIKNGQPVPVAYTLPIRFSLH